MRLPRSQGARSVPGAREDDPSRHAVRVLRKPGACSPPSLCEDDSSHGVVRSPPEHARAAPLLLAKTTRHPTRDDPGSHGNKTRRTVSRANSTTPPFKAPTMSRIDSQDLRVALSCGHGNPVPRDRFTIAPHEVFTQDRPGSPATPYRRRKPESCQFQRYIYIYIYVACCRRPTGRGKTTIPRRF